MQPALRVVLDADALGPCTGMVTKEVRGKVEGVLAGKSDRRRSSRSKCGYVESYSEIPKFLTDKEEVEHCLLSCW